ncbi:MAG: DUF1080 domain-containing protein, partial [Opitutales bacterium]|nr:DUF1080 domain-containing protein [Opitutales bacterium]
MKSSIILGSLSLLLVLISGCSQSGSDVMLFDGKTFNGWEGPMESFRIENGSIVAGTLKADIPKNQFLSTKQAFGDFELRLKFKMIG